MLKKPLNKIRYPFLEGSFPENPLPFKKLNRKAVKLNILSNKKGLSDRIKKIQRNIIEQETVDSIYKKTTLKKQEFVTVDNVKRLDTFLKSSFQSSQKLGLTKNTLRNHKNFAIPKYIFSLEQLRAEFHKKQPQYKKSSSFKSLLQERKKVSLIYGCLGEKQIKKVALQAKQFQGKFDENFIKIVESRLDTAVFRICFFPNIFSAKQWINHGHILVNNSIVTLPGYQLKAGDIITVSPEKKIVLKKKISSFIAEKIKIRSCHYHLRIDTFYTVIKNLISYQNFFSSFFSFFFFEKKKEEKKTKKTNFVSLVSLILTKKEFEEKNKKEKKKMDETLNQPNLTLFFKKSFSKIFKDVNKNKILSSLYLLPKLFTRFSRNLCGSAGKEYKEYRELVTFLKVRNLFTSARSLRQRVTGLRISPMKPLNFEVCYKNMVAIFLYSPQKVALPASLDLHLIAKSFK